ncbi:unnamed protein product [Eruca vesicaria subsp. sativa]|uniref:Uncharacterized protein n=1 Tax=Eruca vesicaria subsp. sativa TaxID=29727 RepID=A0ABC8LUV8_ERUVS|nr:unnamed protein product [Eruca vesicaria subsp. sativa]
MKGVITIASQKVEEFTKEEVSTWNQQNKSEGNGFYQNKGATNSSSSYQNNYSHSSSWNDWGEESNTTIKEAAPKVSQSVHRNNYGNSSSWDDCREEKNCTKKEAAPKVSTSKDSDDGGWAGWDDDKDDDGYCQSAAGDKKFVGHNGK